jgi:hypothetical protein
LGSAGARNAIAVQSAPNLEFGLPAADDCVVTYDVTEGNVADEVVQRPLASDFSDLILTADVRNTRLPRNRRPSGVTPDD